MAEPASPAEVLIAGGGVAALESPMALRDLAGEREIPLGTADAKAVGR